MNLPTRTIPEPLRPGSTVALVAPSSPVPTGRLAGGVALLRSWGLQVVVAPHAHAVAHAGLLAGTDRERAGDLQETWTDPAVDGVFCARGGYGAGRLLEHLDWSAMAATGPKVLVGSSDITALHEAWATRLSLASVFGPMPATELLGGPVPQPDSAEAIHAMVFGAEPEVLAADDLVVAGPPGGGAVSGVLVGGTLSLLAASLGTGYSVPAAGGLVFLEDVGEAPYRVDRLLTQLRGAGWFHRARGVVVGSLHDCGDPVSLRRVLEDRLGDLGVPVLAGLQVGHGPVQRALLLGAPARLDPSAGTLRVSGLGPAGP